MKAKKQEYSLRHVWENKTTTAIPKKLFLLCPECHTEKGIMDFFSGELYFMSCLGIAFKDLGNDFIAQLQFLIQSEKITEIILLADDQCSMMRAANTAVPHLNQHKQVPLIRPEELRYLAEEKQNDLLTSSNLFRQFLFLSTELISKLNASGIKTEISALKYNRQTGLFIAQKLPETLHSN